MVSVMSLLSGCSNDENKEYPPLLTDFVVAEANASGMLARVRLDGGAVYDVTAQGISVGMPDTLLRCVASYTLDDGRMLLYNVTNILSSNPVPLEVFLEEWQMEASDLPRAPVNVVSMWKSGGYINMQLGVLTTGNGSHAYAFCEDGVGEYSLLHLRPMNDAESYTEMIYLSMPVPEGVESLTFSVNTYDGTYTRTF